MKYERDDRDDGRNEERVPEIADEIDLGEHVDEIAERRVMRHEVRSKDLVRLLQRHRHHIEERRHRHEGERRADDIKNEPNHMESAALIGVVR
jgi:hypothetical protein